MQNIVAEMAVSLEIITKITDVKYVLKMHALIMPITNIRLSKMIIK